MSYSMVLHWRLRVLFFALIAFVFYEIGEGLSYNVGISPDVGRLLGLVLWGITVYLRVIRPLIYQ